MENNQYYIDRLEKKSVKPTSIRLLVFKAMVEAEHPVSLLDLETILETVDKSTIFRTLNTFLAHHLIHDIEDGSGSLKYEICSGENACSIDDMHTHFYCEVCHCTFCFKGIHIPVVNLPEGFDMHSINYMAKGICRDCTRQRRQANKQPI